MHAFCYASGLIGFARSTPKGAVTIATGPTRALHSFIEPLARHGYRTRKVRGQPTKVPGSDTLLVPGVPEAPDQGAAMTALLRWEEWIAQHAPSNVAMSRGSTRMLIR